MSVSDWLNNIFENINPTMEDAEVRPPWIRSGDNPPEWEDFQHYDNPNRMYTYARSDWEAEKRAEQQQAEDKARAAEEAAREQEYLNWCDERNAEAQRDAAREAREARQATTSVFFVLGVVAIAIIVALVVGLVIRARVVAAQPAPMAVQQGLVAPAVVPGTGSLIWSEVTPGTWQTMYRGLTIRIEQQGDIFAVYWSDAAQGHPSTFGASAYTLDEAKGKADLLTIQMWEHLPAMLGWH